MTDTNTKEERCGYENTTTGRPCRRIAAYHDGRCYQHTTVDPVRQTHKDLVENPTDSSKSTTERITGTLARLQKRFPAINELSNIDSESDTKYNGPFSYGVEWHAFFFGFALGVWWAHDPTTAINVIAGIIGVAFVGFEASGKAKRVPNYIVAQARQEMHYFAGGLVVGGVFLKHMHGAGEFPFVKAFRMLGLG